MPSVSRYNSLASRKKDPAALRTLGLFSKQTPLEEASALLADEVQEVRVAGPRDIVAEAEECAVRWLGLDAFHEGDDIKVAVHKGGHAVMVLVSATGKGAIYGTSTIKLSRTQWSKLKAIANE